MTSTESSDKSLSKAPTSYPKSKINILLMENIHQSAVDNFVKQGYTVETAYRLEKDELIKKLQYTHVIGVRSKTKLTQEVLSQAKKLMCVGCFCIGTDQTDLKYACKLGIPVFNSPFANTRSVAELIISNIIGLSRKLGDQNRWMHEGKWKKTANGCFEIRNKTLGIVGYGHVGSQVSILAESMGMKVIYYDIIPKLPLGNATAVSSMDDLLKQSDFVTLHVPYTDLTHELINEKQILKMKKGAFLLNAARGKCVNILDVKKYLLNGYLAGAYFDVYPSEPTNDTLALINCPNTILSPHIGGSTQEAQYNIGLEVSNKIIGYINNGGTVQSVNFPEVSLQNKRNVHRILHIHKNVPGVIKECMNILSGYNISSQTLQTNINIGYMIVEIDANKKWSTNIKKLMDKMGTTIKTRVLYHPGMI